MGQWNVQHMSDVLNSYGVVGHLGGALLAVLQTVFPFVPFVLVAGMNVLLFGLWGGLAINYLGACLGAVIAFYAARHYGRSWVQKKLVKYRNIEKLNAQLERRGMLFIALSRLIPVLPSFAINYGAAVMKVRARDFIAGTLIGKAPMIWLESLIGHDLLHFARYKGRLLVLLAAFAVMIVIGNRFKNKWMKNENGM
ncbi:MULTISPECIES: TVP38/TMEM64 family protein [Paenibacillus]|uniref:TVP38/TMEM64 family membrane protein n=1 Tax=Paenibacillus naphthalenovorans TaxID=162209 RepID=A0A0U2VPT2_9BACL|nr:MULTISPECIES: TVP38/TMEM64 family protein [Paenibacillus]ALS21527.1 hypothetical protein IJ22_11510 [Paenibacillus naphthalenovorans]